MPMYSVAFLVRASPGRASPNVNGPPPSAVLGGVQVDSVTPVFESLCCPSTTPFWAELPGIASHSQYVDKAHSDERPAMLTY